MQPYLSGTLTHELSAVRTGIIAATLATNSNIALATAVHAMALPVFYPSSFRDDDSVLALTLEQTKAVAHVRDPACSKAFAALDEYQARWQARLPASPEMLWNWCLGTTQEQLLELLALCSALAVDARQSASHRHGSADRLADALGVEPAAWCSVASLGVLERAPKAFILDVVRRAINPDRAATYAKMKKTVIVERATAALDGQWLPDAVLRSASATTASEPEPEDATDLDEVEFDSAA